MLGCSVGRTREVRRWVLSNLCWTLVCSSWPVLRDGAHAGVHMFAALIKQAPVFTTRQVFHVGHRPAILSARRSDSLEGPGLSVSHHPEEWTEIARLGGHPTWALTRRDRRAGRFLNVLALLAAQRQALTAAFIDAGWLVSGVRYFAVRYDDELESEIESLHPTLDEALAEAELDGDALLRRARRKHGATLLTDDAEGVYVLQRRQAVPTPVLCRWWAQWFRQPLAEVVAWDMALARAVADHSSLDGLWWHERLNPACYSAPRGVIVPGALPKWSTTDAATRNPLRDAGAPR